MAHTNENSGMGVVLGILLAVLLAIGGYYFIQSRNNAGINNFDSTQTVDSSGAVTPTGIPQDAAPVNPDNAVPADEAAAPTVQ